MPRERQWHHERWDKHIQTEQNDTSKFLLASRHMAPIDHPPRPRRKRRLQPTTVTGPLGRSIVAIRARADHHETDVRRPAPVRARPSQGAAPTRAETPTCRLAGAEIKTNGASPKRMPRVFCSSGPPQRRS